jgi:hypothetical protein
LLLHLYVQAAWYCWWLGTKTFGMRGLTTGAVLLVPLLAHTLRQRSRGGLGIAPLIAAVSVSSSWPFLHMRQDVTNLTSFARLLEAQVGTLTRIDMALPMLVLTALALAAGAARKGRRHC